MVYPDKHGCYIVNESQTGTFPHHLQALKKDNDIKSREKCCSRESEGYSKCSH